MATIGEELKTKFKQDKHRFITNLIFTVNSFQNAFNVFLKPYHLSSQQYNILRILRGAADWTSMNIVKDLMIDKAPNTTRLADKLNGKGHIERQRSDQDRRGVYLSITPKGWDLLEEIDLDQAGVQNDYLARITDEEARQFSKILDRMKG